MHVGQHEHNSLHKFQSVNKIYMQHGRFLQPSCKVVQLIISYMLKVYEPYKWYYTDDMQACHKFATTMKGCNRVVTT